MENTDESLIEAHRRGETAAFDQLVRRYGDHLLGYLIRMSGSRDQAEDLFQETFKRVHEKAHTYRGGSFKSWLFTIATRAAIDNLRRRKRQSILSLDQNLDCDGDGQELGAVAVADSSNNPAQVAVKTEQKAQVRQAVELLPAKQRATLVLAYFQELSYREVADVLGCSVGTVKTQMSRALQTLARRLPDMAEEVE
ncbi:MAG: sigma-70 family RNA polymerase sigma factor [Phycisphaerales bacterium]|nr:MAG: sigma-70 family RNA polymerase sigma factor [Phycisphaerales bacterium]